MTDRSITAARARRRLGAAAVATTLVAGGLLATHLSPTNAAAAPAKLTREQLAGVLLARRGEFLSSGAASFLRYTAGKTRPEGLIGEKDAGAPLRAAAPSGAGGAKPASGGLANVRVNNPATDSFLDQTTQSETSVAVAGKNVAVGFNDSQHVYPGGFLTAGANLSGYAFSADGGKTFTDGGTLPSSPGQIHFGDPWLGADREGNFYYSDLSLSAASFNLEVAVSTSANGGKTWAPSVFASPNDPALFYSGDKEALTVGRSKADPDTDTVYVAWDDFVDDGQGTFFAGLPVARSEDGGQSFQLSYADKIVTDPNGCSFGQYIGAQPLVDPATGDLTVTALRIAVDDPNCTFDTPVVFDQVATRSTDGGRTFSPLVSIASVGDVFDIDLGPGRAARSLPLPTITRKGKKLYVAWNEGPKGSSRILWSSSSDGGATWSPTSTVPAADGEDFQPALSADGKGLHLAYYHRYPDNTIDVLLADSQDGAAWTTRRVTSAPFPGVFNDPQFDPVIAPAYMGDYIANVAAGGNLYLAWGDNRNIVKNPLWENGRNDPDVFFAKR